MQQTTIINKADCTVNLFSLHNVYTFFDIHGTGQKPQRFAMWMDL